MKVSQPSKSSSANTSGKGFRRSKIVAPQVTSIVWNSVAQSFLTDLAAGKVGGSSNLPPTTDEINTIAFGCYSAKDLPFILQGLGFSNNDSPYPTKKKELIKAAVSIFHRVSCVRNDRSNEASAFDPTKLAKSSSSSLVSVSPQSNAAVFASNAADVGRGSLSPGLSNG